MSSGVVPLRLVSLVRAGDVFIEDPESFDADDEAMVDSGLVRYLEQRCALEEESVALHGRNFRTPVYRHPRNEDRAYLILDEQHEDRRVRKGRAALLPTLVPYLDRARETVCHYDHEFLRQRYRDLASTFIAPTLELRQPGEAPVNVSVAQVQRLQRAVIVGEPGAGKTSLLRWLALEAGDSVREGRSDLVPIYVQLRALSDAPGANERAIESLIENAARDLSLGIAEAAEEGRLAVFFDGLDEVVDYQRTRVAAGIRSFAEAFPAARVVISSRTVTYGDEFPSFPRLEIQPFSRSQMHDWVWRAAPEPAVWRRFVRELNENESVAALTANPLFLSIIFEMYRTQAASPRERAVLSSSCVRTLTDDWDRQRGVARSSRWRNWKTTFAYLCWLSYDLVERDEQSFYTWDVVRRRSPHFEPADASAEFAALAEKTGLLSKVGTDRWAFTHVALRDYLAAEYVVSSAEDARSLLPRQSDRSDLSASAVAVWIVACGSTLNADSLVELPMRDSPAVSVHAATLLIEALRQDVEVREPVLERATAHCVLALEQGLSAATIERFVADGEGSPYLHLLLAPTADVVSLRALLAAMIGVRGARFAGALLPALDSSTLDSVRAVARLLRTDAPLEAVVADSHGVLVKAAAEIALPRTAP